MVSLIIKEILAIYLCRLFDVGLGLSWCGSISAAVGSCMGAGIGLACSPTMLAVGVVVGLFAIPVLRCCTQQKQQRRTPKYKTYNPNTYLYN